MIRQPVLSFLLMLTLGITFAQTQTLRTYKIGLVRNIGGSPLHVAEHQGFWTDLGVKVKLVVFNTNQELNTALENQKIDLALGMIGSWVGMYLDGVPLTLICETYWSHGSDKIIVKKDADEFGLKGAQIGVYLDKPSVTFFLYQYLARKGLSFADVRIVELSPEIMSRRFIAGQLKLIVSYGSYALDAERLGRGRVVATSRGFPGCMPGGFVVHRERLGILSKSDLAAVFKGWLRAVDWIRQADNHRAYAGVLNMETLLGEQPYVETGIKRVLASISIHDRKTLLQRNSDAGGLIRYLEQLKVFLGQSGQLTRNLDPNVLFDNTVIVDVLR
ncbi:MAG: ABC transporter substrate-binding protein [Acidobacteriota bacterium]|nr:ABC transporter substrate-binding protein [Acidobacteriota bacterium]